MFTCIFIFNTKSTKINDSFYIYLGGLGVKNENIELKLLVRNKKSVSSMDKKIGIIEGDTFNKESLKEALKDVEVAYYLIHSLSNENFKDLDKISAQNFLDVAALCGVKRIIYLS